MLLGRTFLDRLGRLAASTGTDAYFHFCEDTSSTVASVIAGFCKLPVLRVSVLQHAPTSSHGVAVLDKRRTAQTSQVISMCAVLVVRATACVLLRRADRHLSIP